MHKNKSLAGLTDDGEALEKKLPQLERAEQERMLQEEKAKAQHAGERETQIGGAWGHESTSLTRGPIDELNITYKASDKKVVLIAKVRHVREARQILQEN